MTGQGKWNDAVQKAKSPRPKTRGRKPRGKSLLSVNEQSSGSRESAVSRQIKTDFLSFSDDNKKGENDHAVETISAAVSDEPVVKQDEDVRSIGGIAFQ